MKQWYDILIDYRNKKKFNSKEWINNKINNFNNYLIKHNLTGAVLSVSGGIDSAVTLALLEKTHQLKNSNLKKIVAINQPIHSSDWAFNRSKELCKKFNVELITIDQTNIFDSLTKEIESKIKIKIGKFSAGQLKSYMRTPVNYYISQLLNQEGFPSIVMGTGNKDEDGYLAYFCKAGDGVVDVQLISDLHKSEVFKIGKELKIPESILKAKPSADLWEGQEDEKELGFSYDFIEFFTDVYLKLKEHEKIELLNSLTNNSKTEVIQNIKLCETIHYKNIHKLKGIINF